MIVDGPSSQARVVPKGTGAWPRGCTFFQWLALLSPHARHMSRSDSRGICRGGDSRAASVRGISHANHGHIPGVGQVWVGTTTGRIQLSLSMLGSRNDGGRLLVAVIPAFEMTAILELGSVLFVRTLADTIVVCGRYAECTDDIGRSELLSVYVPSCSMCNHFQGCLENKC
jgi:hypothetical protein